MPLHDFRCERGHVTEEFVGDGVDGIICACHKPATKVFLTAPMAFIRPDVHYTSPIDGRPITTMAAHREDLERNGCIAYDPEMKTDQRRRIEAEDKALDAAVDETVDRAIDAMPSIKREKLAAELAGGVDVAPTRGVG
jgi:hypothetical protein